MNDPTIESVTLSGVTAGPLCELVEQTSLATITVRDDSWTETSFYAAYPVAAWSSGERALWDLLVGLADGRVDLGALDTVRANVDAENVAAVEVAIAAVTKAVS